MTRIPRILPLALLLLSAAACGEEEDAKKADDTLDVPETYDFPSRYVEGASSVAYDGQTARHVLLADLTSYIGGLSAQIDAGTFTPSEEGEVIAALDYYFRFDGDASGGDSHGVRTTPSPLQSTYDAVSTKKMLVDKLAGNDASTDHRDWSTRFRGWSDASIASNGGSIGSPEGLVMAWFETIEAQAIARAEGRQPTGPGDLALPVHVTAEGLDLQQLVQKFLTVGITFSQGADDYLDDTTEGKGLLTPHERDGDKPWTKLEHQWDEGFGYFGAARDYASYTDDEIAAAGGRDDRKSGYFDTNGDGKIDLLSEYNFGTSTNAAKRDRAANASAPTDLTGEAIDGFLTGRAILAATPEGPLDAATLDRLREQRDLAIGAWEKALAATVVHYINNTLKAMGTFGTGEYDFLKHAKGWSEMKGFALGFQFNPKSPVSEADFVRLHELLGDRPVLAAAGTEAVAAYRGRLLEARGLLKTAYGFAEANMGDDDGKGGW